jgi:hypothetical protein
MDTPDQLQAQLATLEEQIRKERCQSAEDLLSLQERLRAQAAVIGTRGVEIEKLERTLADIRKRLADASADLETFSRLLHDSTGRPSRVARGKTGLERLLSRLLGRGKSREVDVPAGAFDYHLTTTPYRIYRPGGCTLSGWVVSRERDPVDAIRVRFAGRTFDGRFGMPSPEAAAEIGPQAAGPHPGFEVTFDTPPGTHWLRLEARLGTGNWRCILKIPAWSLDGSTRP